MRDFRQAGAAISETSGGQHCTPMPFVRVPGKRNLAQRKVGMMRMRCRRRRRRRRGAGYFPTKSSRRRKRRQRRNCSDESHLTAFCRDRVKGPLAPPLRPISLLGNLSQLLPQYPIEGHRIANGPRPLTSNIIQGPSFEEEI